jgi:hypothetical protein
MMSKSKAKLIKEYEARFGIVVGYLYGELQDHRPCSDKVFIDEENVRFKHKVSLLLAARDKAHNVEFKILWNDKIKELLSSRLA